MAIWAREDAYGTMRCSVTLTRSYKSDHGFGDTHALDRHDLSDAIALLTLAQAIVPPESRKKTAAAS